MKRFELPRSLSPSQLRAADAILKDFIADLVDQVCEYLQACQDDQVPAIDEGRRSRLHALTRKVTISDEELAAALRKITDRPDVLAFVLDLRDRYEEHGRYAINAPQEAPAPSSESPQAPNTPIR